MREAAARIFREVGPACKGKRCESTTWLRNCRVDSVPSGLRGLARRSREPGLHVRTAGRGFTLVELMMVLAVIAILALIALPSFQDRIVREQIVEAVRWADFVKKPVAATWALTQTLPADNAAAELPPADRIVSHLVRSVSVEGGAIQISFGNQANGAIKGKTLSLRPAIVADAPVVPVSWVCGNAPPPDRMTVRGPARTDIAARYLPVNCR